MDIPSKEWSTNCVAEIATWKTISESLATKRNVNFLKKQKPQTESILQFKLCSSITFALLSHSGYFTFIMNSDAKHCHYPAEARMTLTHLENVGYFSINACSWNPVININNYDCRCQAVWNGGKATLWTECLRWTRGIRTETPNSATNLAGWDGASHWLST